MPYECLKMKNRRFVFWAWHFQEILPDLNQIPRHRVPVRNSAKTPARVERVHTGIEKGVKPLIMAETYVYFENLDPMTQEIIVDLVVSIMENKKKKEGEIENETSCHLCPVEPRPSPGLV
jgi:hypothetical protein